LWVVFQEDKGTIVPEEQADEHLNRWDAVNVIYEVSIGLDVGVLPKWSWASHHKLNDHQYV